MPILDEEKHYNSSVLINPDPESFHLPYHKRHQFGNEKDGFDHGTIVPIWNLGGWFILPQICYDLRFPETARPSADQYQLIIYIANWPKERIGHWQDLLKARAIENQCYVIGVNCLGNNPQYNLNYPGKSMVVHPSGEILLSMEETKYSEIEIQKNEVEKVRKTFPFLADRWIH